MALLSVTQNILAAKRRKSQSEQKRSKKTLYYGLWSFAALAGVSLAIFSLLNTDFDAKRRQATGLNIDPITTASVQQHSKLLRRTLVASDRKTIAEMQRRLDTFAGVIKRLRKEQATLHNRLAALDNSIRNQKPALQKAPSAGLKADTSRSEITSTPENIKQPVIAEPKQQSDVKPWSTILKVEKPAIDIVKTIPRKVQTRQTDTANITSIVKRPPKKQAIPDSDISPKSDRLTSSKVPENKTQAKVAQSQAIDQTTVGSINQGKIQSHFAIDLGTNSTTQDALNLWTNLKLQSPEILDDYSPLYVTGNDDKGSIRLLVGPYLNAADAIKACVTLRQTDSFCKTTLFP